MFIQWLQSHNILKKFQTPDTVPSVLYALDLPDDEYTNIENILNFLSNEGYLSEASGTFSLTQSIDKILESFDDDIIEENKDLPITQFIKYGLSLFDDKLQGGSGEWDLNKASYLFERGIIQNILKYLSLQLDNTIKWNQEKPPGIITIYSLYCEDIVLKLSELYPDAEIHIVVPTDKLKKKAITYCELIDICEVSKNVFIKQNYSQTDVDMIIVPNGIGLHFNTNEFVQFFHKCLKDNGQLYMALPNRHSQQTGVELLLHTHPHFQELQSIEEIKKLFQANGFTSFSTAGPNDYFLLTSKEGL